MEIAKTRFPHSHNLDDYGIVPLNPSAYGIRILRATSQIFQTTDLLLLAMMPTRINFLLRYP